MKGPPHWTVLTDLGYMPDYFKPERLADQMSIDIAPAIQLTKAYIKLMVDEPAKWEAIRRHDYCQARRDWVNDARTLPCATAPMDNDDHGDEDERLDTIDLRKTVDRLLNPMSTIGLTPIQTSVLLMLADGWTNGEIASRLSVTHQRVTTIRQRIGQLIEGGRGKETRGTQ